MALRDRHVPLLALSAVLLAACGGPAPGDGGKPGDTVPIPPAQPLDVTVVMDDARAVSQTVPTGGGTVSVVAADGTEFLLTVPANALLEETVVTMTPLLDVAGAPLAGLAHGVSLEPDGLRLYDLATLELIPPAGAGSHVAGFGTLGDGKDFHLQPLAAGQGVELQLMHFSEHGAFFSEVGPILVNDPVEFMPFDWEGQLRHMLAGLLKDEREAQLAGLPGDPDFDWKLEAILRTFYQKVVEPMLDRIRSDCSYAMGNASKVLGWNRAVALVGKEDVFTSETRAVVDAVVAGADNCWREATSTCVNPADADRFQEVVRAARLNQLLGGDPGVYDPYDPELRCKGWWTGTIMVTQEEVLHVDEYREEPCCNGRTETSHTVKDRVTAISMSWTVTGSPDFPQAQFEGGVTLDYSRHGVDNWWTYCHDGWLAMEKVDTMLESGSATAEGPALVGISVADEGGYRLTANPANVSTTGTRTTEHTWTISPDCKGNPSSESRSNTSLYSPGLWTLTVMGTVDPNEPDVISGSETIVEEEGDEIVTTTMTWHLERIGNP